MGDPLSSIQSLSSVHDAQARELRSSFLQLQQRISALLSDADVHINSDTIVLEWYGEDEALYGHLNYSRGDLAVAYRTTEDDAQDAWDRNVLDDPIYSVRKIEDCSFTWLRLLARGQVLESFFGKMIAELTRQRAEADAGISVLGTALSAPIRNAEEAFEATARELGYEDVIIGNGLRPRCTSTLLKRSRSLQALLRAS
jgi:hypothetical protein